MNVEGRPQSGGGLKNRPIVGVVEGCDPGCVQRAWRRSGPAWLQHGRARAQRRGGRGWPASRILESALADPAPAWATWSLAAIWRETASIPAFRFWTPGAVSESTCMSRPVSSMSAMRRSARSSSRLSTWPWSEWARADILPSGHQAHARPPTRPETRKCSSRPMIFMAMSPLPSCVRRHASCDRTRGPAMRRVGIGKIERTRLVLVQRPVFGARPRYLSLSINTAADRTTQTLLDATSGQLFNVSP